MCVCMGAGTNKRWETNRFVELRSNDASKISQCTVGGLKQG